MKFDYKTTYIALIHPYILVHIIEHDPLNDLSTIYCFYTEVSVSHNFMETEAYSLRFGEFKAVGKKLHNS